MALRIIVRGINNTEIFTKGPIKLKGLNGIEVDTDEGTKAIFTQGSEATGSFNK